MTLSEIVREAKEGDRFVADWQTTRYNNESYYYREGESIYFHSTVDGDSLWDNSNVADFTADYEFLPPEPKFKVGDRVIYRCFANPPKVYTIQKQAYDTYNGTWLYFIPLAGQHRECDLELYAPDTCDCCGQEVGEKEKEVSLGWKVGDRARVNWSWHSEHGCLVTIKEVRGEGAYKEIIADSVNPKTSVK